MIEKGKRRLKHSHKVFEEQGGFDTLLSIYLLTILIQLEVFLDGIKYCATNFGKCFFENNIPFALPLTRFTPEYCCNNYNETKLINGYK